MAPSSLLQPDTIASLLALAGQAPAGCFVEVGVYLGGSAWHLAALAREQNRTLYLFDTFAGLPYCDRDRGDDLPRGEFGDTSIEDVRRAIPDAVIVPGIFPDSALLQSLNMGPIACAHVDVDQYRSVYESAEYLAPRMAPGGVIVFDDFGCLTGATQAVLDFFAGKDIHTTQQGRAYIRA